MASGGRRRSLYWLLSSVLIIIFALFFVRENVIFWLNVSEFGELFIQPIYFSFLSGLVLAFIALFRVDFKNRRSVTWWVIRIIVKSIRSRGTVENISPLWFDFDSFKMPPLKFFVWQVTKVLIGMFFFTNLMLGMAVNAIILGWDPGLKELPKILSLPFVTPALDPTYATANVLPLIPSLTLLVPPILRVLWVRLIFLVVVTQLIRAAASLTAIYLWDMATPKLSRFMPLAQSLVAVFLLWFMFTSFFSSFIDFNSKYWILGLGAAGFSLTTFAFLDWRRSKNGAGVDLNFSRRRVYVQLGTLSLIALITGSAIFINNSIADARKLEMLGPYNAQMVFVNRYLAELDEVKEVPYVLGSTSIAPEKITGYIESNRWLLDRVRLWDWEAVSDKLKPQIGLIPYIEFADSDITRFNGSLYWSASMEPVLPNTVKQADEWYATHLVYTHVPTGWLMLDGHDGVTVDVSKFFPQRIIYYGEGGLFKDTWFAFPVGRSESAEIDGYFYNGRGGVNVPPPLSWFFEPSFLLSYPTTTMRIFRYRDVYDRMRLIFPYFTYEFQGAEVDVWPVTDGKQTFWVMPLIVFLDAKNVPWSHDNPLGRLVGYALIDPYHGDIQLLVLGNDYFSQVFKKTYSAYVSTEVPEWLKPQLRYPEELFEWRVSMYNFFHVIDPAAYIAAKEFFTVPQGLDTYYIIAQPPGFENPEFTGLLSLELRGGLGENLAGYMIVRNDYPRTGEMTFYKVALDVETKLLGPTAAREALGKDPEYAKLRTLLSNPRVGDTILYRMGDYDVYFIPVYTSPGGGVVTQLGTIATVGADFTGNYYVGLGSTVYESFRTFLAKMAGGAPVGELSEEERIAKMVDFFEGAGLTVSTPTAISPPVSFNEGSRKYVSEADWNGTQALLDAFLEDWVKPHSVSRVFMWREDSKVNFGIMMPVEGVTELHYIVIELK